MLKIEINTPEMEQRVLAAFQLWVDVLPDPAIFHADFEHGQWWVTDLGSGAQYAAVCALGGDAVDGFSFEQVTEGDYD